VIKLKFKINKLKKTKKNEFALTFKTGYSSHEPKTNLIENK
jgi:hypothetical protein